MLRRTLLFFTLFLPLTLAARPVVVELFTSQGCSSCPPADAMLGEMIGKPDLLPLSFHVTYWDYLGWKDEFALAQSDRRQKRYNTKLEIDSLFTPQVVVDGLATAIGTHRNAITKIITKANENLPDIPVNISVDKEKEEVLIKVSGVDDGVQVDRLPIYLDVWVVTFQKGFRTPISGGENVGKDVASYNIVRKLILLGKWNQRTSFFRFPLNNFVEDAMAILVQEEEGGRIMGVGTYYQR